jgi:hypothetical protein
VSDYISATLQEGSVAVALAARPSGSQAIRARGDQRRRRNAAGLAVTVLAVVTAGAGAYPLARDLSTVPAATASSRSVMPKVAGDSLAAAERAIGRAGLSVGHVSQQPSSAVVPGIVIRTSPTPGAAEIRGPRSPSWSRLQNPHRRAERTRDDGGQRGAASPGTWPAGQGPPGGVQHRPSRYRRRRVTSARNAGAPWRSHRPLRRGGARLLARESWASP